MKINFKFKIGQRVIDETRNGVIPDRVKMPYVGDIKSAGWDGKRIYYAVECRNSGRTWTAHENALTNFKEFDRTVKAVEPETSA